MTETTETTDPTPFVINGEEIDQINAVADYIESLDKDELGIAARPHKAIVAGLRARALAIAEEIEFIELRSFVDQTAVLLYDNLDPDLLANPNPSWNELDDETRDNLRYTSLATLRSIGALTIDEDRAERLIASFRSTESPAPQAQPQAEEPGDTFVEEEPLGDTDEQTAQTVSDDSQTIEYDADVNSVA